MSNHRTIGEVEEEYFRNHPDEIDDYIPCFSMNMPRAAILRPCCRHCVSSYSYA
jgi:hypothetical protein